MKSWILRSFVGLVLLLGVLAIAVGASADSAAEYQRGLDLSSARQYRSAVKVFTRVVESDPEWAARAQLQLASACFNEGMLDQAIEEFRAGFQHVRLPADEDVLVKLNQGLARSCRGAVGPALWEQVESAVGSSGGDYPEHVGWLVFLGHKAEGDPGEAMTVLADLIWRFPQSLRVLEYKIAMAELLQKSGRKSEAVAEIEFLCDWVSDNPSRFGPVQKIELGQKTLWTFGRTQKARDYLSLLLKNDQTVDPVRLKYQLAYCSYIERNITAAREEFLQLYQTCGEYRFRASALYMVGDCSLRLNDLAQARWAFEGVARDYAQKTDLARSAAMRLDTLGAESKRAPATTPSAEAEHSIAQIENQEVSNDLAL